MDSIGKRFIYLVGLQFNNLNEFANQTGIHYSNLNQIKNNKRDLTMSLLTKLLEIFPYLNVGWLLTGDGEIFHQKDSEVSEPTQNYSSEIIVERLFLKMLDNKKVVEKIATIKSSYS